MGESDQRGRLFGTDGVRGVAGCDLTASLALNLGQAAAAVLGAGGTPGSAPVAVVGRDPRVSGEFLEAAVVAGLASAGVDVLRLGVIPTPGVAYLTQALGATFGVVISASHNPARDNGYKVYWRDGAQIVPPLDAAIAAEIDAIGSLRDIPLGDSWTSLTAEQTVEPYLARAVATLDPATPRDLAVVYTPLHGVGRDTLLAAFARAGFPAPLVVAEQADPDPDFPTLGFPNPEEPGAMELAFAAASAAGPERTPDLVLANDPDADRLAVAVPLPAAEGPGWRMLHGDEVGALLAAHLVERRAEGTFATTVVSSSLLSRIAGAAGLRYAQTLTGFKWISKIHGLTFGYEEALGYCVDPEAVRDKDGITAALLVAEYAAALKAQGRTLLDELAALDAKYSAHRTDQLPVRVSDLAQIPRMMAALRQDPPKELGGVAVRQMDDLSQGSETLPPTDGLRFVLDGARVVVRPSGTEPKLKCYLEAGSTEVLAAIKESLREVLGV